MEQQKIAKEEEEEKVPRGRISSHAPAYPLDMLDGSPAPRYTWRKGVEKNRPLPNKVSPREHAKGN